MINKKIINESLDFYEIDNKYKEKCYNTVINILFGDSIDPFITNFKEWSRRR